MSAQSRSFDPPSGVVNVEAFTGALKEKRPRRLGSISDKAFDKLRDEAVACMKSGEWGDACSRTMVALFAILHERVYGVACADLSPSTRLVASFSAGRMLDREFSGDVAAMAMFLRWTWMREKEREVWRRSNGREGGTVSWRLQFNGRLLTDYRIALARQHATQRRVG